MIKNKSKRFILSLFCGLLSAIFISFSGFNAGCEDIRQNVLRLHIIANSNSSLDQALKLKIRDRIIEESGMIFEDVTDLEDAVKQAENKISLLEDIANRVIKEEGISYTAKARIDKQYFETRVYDDFTLPAGVYDSLIIDVGKAEGKNWWCVIFPEICIPSAVKGELSDTVSDRGVDIAVNQNRYILRFRAVEIYEELKNLFKR